MPVTVTNNTVQQPQNQQPVQEVQNAQVPAELQNASSTSGLKRVLAGIFSLGITEIVRFFTSDVQAAPADPPRVPHEAPLPPAEPQADVVNRELGNKVYNNQPLQSENLAAMNEAFDVLRTQYGENAVPQGATLKDFFDSDAKASMKKTIQDSPDLFTPSAFKALILEHGQSKAAKNVALSYLKQLRDNGEFGEIKPRDVSLNKALTLLKSVNPEGYATLLRSQSKDEVLAHLNDFKKTIGFLATGNELSGRCAGHPAHPPQNRTCPIKASGSSNVHFG